MGWTHRHDTLEEEEYRGAREYDIRREVIVPELAKGRARIDHDRRENRHGETHECESREERDAPRQREEYPSNSGRLPLSEPMEIVSEDEVSDVSREEIERDIRRDTEDVVEHEDSRTRDEPQEEEVLDDRIAHAHDAAQYRHHEIQPDEHVDEPKMYVRIAREQMVREGAEREDVGHPHGIHDRPAEEREDDPQERVSQVPEDRRDPPARQEERAADHEKYGHCPPTRAVDSIREEPEGGVSAGEVGEIGGDRVEEEDRRDRAHAEYVDIGVVDFLHGEGGWG